jgi:hypothetical protein
MSSTANALLTLQQAANQVLQEEKEEGFDGLLFAADQIANERGLSSPLRRRSPNHLDRSIELSQSIDRNMISEKVIVHTNGLDTSLQILPNSSNNAENSKYDRETEDDALALMKQMNIEPVLLPKQSATVGFQELDVQAILNEHEKFVEKEQKGRISPRPGQKMVNPHNFTHPLPFQSKKSGSHIKQRYLNRLSLSRQGSVNTGKSTTSTLRRGSIISEPSKAATMLAMSEEKEYGDRIRMSFRTGTEEMLFRSMQIIHPFSRDDLGGTGRGRSREEWRNMRDSSDRLSRPTTDSPTRLDIKFDPTLKYSTYDDAKECTFRPLINGKKKKEKKDSDDEGKVEDPKYSFISRQEAEERMRREELAFKQGKLDYDAKIDKKVCPKCGLKQSYDEVKEKRKLCPVCSVEYTNPQPWGKVSKQFFQKCYDYSRRITNNKKRIKEEFGKEYKYITRTVYDRKTGKLVMIQEERKNQLTEEEMAEFFERLKKQMAEHKIFMKTLEKEIYDEYCTFKPHIEKYGEHKKLDDELEEMLNEEDEEEGQVNPVKAFLKRYKEDMERRREKMPERYKSLRKYHKKRHDGDDEFNLDDDNHAKNEGYIDRVEAKSFRF